MPLPMVHLAIATKLINIFQIERYQSEYLLGNIAPDAIHMRAKTNDIDKEKTHLSFPKDNSEHNRVNILYKTNKHKAEPLPIFTLGYITHILTDRLWWQEVIPLFRKEIPNSISEEEIRRLYYRDTDKIDWDLYNQEKWRTNAWKCLSSAIIIDFKPYLSKSEIDRWRNRTLQWYEKYNKEGEINPIYITNKQVVKFIDRAVEYTKRYIALWNKS